MDAIQAELMKLLVPVVAAAALGGMKWLYPRVKEKVPNLMWPFAIYGLARAGTALCRATGQGCSGNPFAWDETTVQAMAAAFVAMALREAVKSARSGDLIGKIKGLVDKVRPQP